jgi:hypothetical protein
MFFSVYIHPEGESIINDIIGRFINIINAPPPFFGGGVGAEHVFRAMPV